jgi:hypothetical protein
VVFNGRETWSLTLKEEHRLRVFKNKVLGRDEVTGRWRTLHTEELRNLYFLSNINQNGPVKEDEMGRACSKHEGEEECIQWWESLK